MSPMKQVHNERSEAIELIKRMDEIVKRNTWQIKSVGGESTLNTGEKRMFPDIILYGDTARSRVLQGWEIKMPDVPITDTTFVTDAQRKADTFGVNSCVIWNFSYGKLYMRADKEWEVLKEWTLPQIKTRVDVGTHQADWSAMIETILLEINTFFVTGALLSAGIGDVIATSAYSAMIELNKQSVTDALCSANAHDTTIGAFLSQWWRSVEKEYAFDEDSMYSAYAKYLLLNWLNKLTFANLIKAYHNPALLVEHINRSMTPADALSVFEEITAKCDFFNIFAPVQYLEILPAVTWTDLTDYNAFLIENNVSQLPQETLQAVLEHSIDQFKRSTMGLFATPVKLAQILVRAGLLNLTLPTIDPCCGTGTIVKEVLNAKIRASGNVAEAYATTYAADKFSFPLQTTNIAMTSANSIRLPSLLFQMNAFDLQPGAIVTITNPIDGSKQDYTLPKWGNIVSNLPFVAFDQDGREEQEFIPAVRDTIKRETKVTLSAKADLYQFLLLSMWRKMENGASMAVITSNSWLGTVAGKSFFKALNLYFHVNCVVASGNGKWFQNADVVTTMLFIAKKEKPLSPLSTRRIFFGLTGQKIDEWNDEIADNIVNSILLRQELSKNSIALRSYSLTQINEIASMNIALNSLFYNVAWLPKLKAKLCPVTDLFHVFRGMKTAQDDFYYLPHGDEVDPPYVGKVFKSAKSAEYLLASADVDAVVCDKTIGELESLGHYKTVQWIQRFSTNLNQSLPHKETFWNNIADGSFSGSQDVRLFTGMNPERRIFYGLLREPAKINQRAIGFSPLTDSVNLELCHALLNSIVGTFYAEATGFPKGLGALDNRGENTKQILMLNPRLLSEDDEDKILNAFSPLLGRKIMATDLELQRKDRLVFEQAVAECFGYVELFGEIKDTVLEMQRVRLSVKK